MQMACSVVMRGSPVVDESAMPHRQEDNGGHVTPGQVG